MRDKRRLAARAILALAGVELASQCAAAASPLSYLTSSGPKADSTLGLTWGLLIISIVVVVAMSALVLWAVFRSRAPGESSAPSMPSHEPSSFNIFGWGLATTSLILVGCVAWTMVTLAAIDQPAKTPALTIEVTGNQWWWQVRYLSDEPAKTFVTANEIHVPVGEPVRVKLRSDDVIHSFWIPALAGKTDLIPGQVNTTWLEARKAGTYIGTCAEYCGLQHAHMGIRVVAEAADKFEAWRDNQLKAPAPATSDDLKVGVAAFSRRCAACHTVLGTTAGGILGPNLSHLMTRETLAAGEIPNDEGDLAGWIADPQQIKPGTQMPKIELTGDELQAITTYLISLK